MCTGVFREEVSKGYYSGFFGMIRTSKCDKCRSLGCRFSRSFVPVKDWKCYPKDMENVL